MNQSDSHPHSSFFLHSDRPISEGEAAAVLESALLSSKATPIDELLTRLTRRDGAAWIEEQLAPGKADPRWPGGDCVRATERSVSKLNELKNLGKKLGREGGSSALRSTGLLIYLIVTAAALIQHGGLPSELDAATRSRSLRDLAAVTEDPWHSFFERAAEVLDEAG